MIVAFLGAVEASGFSFETETMVPDDEENVTDIGSFSNV